MADRNVTVDRAGLDWLLNDSEPAFALWTEQIAQNIEGQAKINIVANNQVDTGAMLGAVSVIDGDTPKEKRVIVGVDYAIYQEYGSGSEGAATGAGDNYSTEIKGQPARPFLSPALEQYRDVYEEGLVRLIETAGNE